MIILYFKSMLKRLSVSLLVLLTVFSNIKAEAGAVPLLVKIEKGQPHLERVLSALDLTVLQEMDSFYLALVEREEASLLRREGFRFYFLTSFNPNRFYYLARITNVEEYRQLSSFARLIRLEGQNCLLISEEKADGKFPLTVRWKPLSRQGRPVIFPQPVSGAIRTLKIEEAFQQIASEISTDNLRAMVTSLQNFGTRYVYTPNCQQAADYIFNYFSGLGLQPRFHEFTYSGAQLKNVVVDIPGQTYPDQVVIVCAHYDSISDARWNQAPGADDNASGTAAVMEAARVLKNRPHDFTIRLVAFTAEEVGLVGSDYYASTAEASRDKVMAVINLDMIAYADALPEDLDIITNETSDWLAERAVDSTITYGLIPARKFVEPSFVYSDHASFWDRGISAICAIEDQDVNNPYYHRTTDTVDTLNFDFYLGAARGTVVCASEVAQLLRPGRLATPPGITLSLTTYASIFNYLKKVKLKWGPVSGAAGYNVYRSHFSHTGYEKLNGQPLSQTEFVDLLLPTELPFYYAVTAVDSLGQESNMSKELAVAPGVVYFQKAGLWFTGSSAAGRRN